MKIKNKDGTETVKFPPRSKLLAEFKCSVCMAETGLDLIAFTKTSDVYLYLIGQKGCVIKDDGTFYCGHECAEVDGS